MGFQCGSWCRVNKTQLKLPLVFMVDERVACQGSGGKGVAWTGHRGCWGPLCLQHCWPHRAGLGQGVSLALFKVSQIAVVLFGCSASAAGWSIPAQMSMCVWVEQVREQLQSGSAGICRLRQGLGWASPKCGSRGSFSLRAGQQQGVCLASWDCTNAWAWRRFVQNFQVPLWPFLWDAGF